MNFTYRTKLDDISELWEQNAKDICSSIKDRGLLFIIAVLIVSAICLVQSILILLSNTSMTIDRADHLFSLDEEEPFFLKRVANRLNLRNLDGYDKKVAESALWEDGEVSSPKAVALCAIRDHFIRANGNLKGTILKTTFPKITGEELLSSMTTGEELSKPYITQRITFGNDMNGLLKQAFKDKIKHRKIRGQEDTYIVFEGNDLLAFENKLKQVFMNENIKIRLTTLPQNK